jgi:hypothetical protein
MNVRELKLHRLDKMGDWGEFSTPERSILGRFAAGRDSAGSRNVTNCVTGQPFRTSGGRPSGEELCAGS